MKGKMKLLVELFVTFFKIGLFTFGGGYAMIPLIEREVVEGKKWISSEDVLDMLAIAESTPGPIMINTATYIGTTYAGVLGGIFATLGAITPSFVIILLISFVLEQFKELKAVQYAFNGIRAGVLALLFKALWGMYKKSPKGWAAYVIMAAAFVLTAFLKINVLFVIIFCAVFGLATATMAERRMQK